ncbi:hypothetical protein PV728_44390 [Streptomyces europaeiscabiei]|uniref:hypothetical protein n=1 Tax=Streptomyces TaxID=1883 RepID=UPI0015C50242|nr:MULTISPECIES: hypothetical protein [Streptomyces]MDX3637113.1 hypothetical protein [Streptomyces europaeiscabiei]MDX3655257.1 hypothetical protein [Streptomyces europaeiscabiei]
MTTTRALRRTGPGVTVPAPGQPAAAIPPGTPAEAAVPTREDSPQSVVGHVADFYGAYTDALHARCSCSPTCCGRGARSTPGCGYSKTSFCSPRRMP